MYFLLKTIPFFNSEIIYIFLFKKLGEYFIFETIKIKLNILILYNINIKSIQQSKHQIFELPL